MHSCKSLSAKPLFSTTFYRRLNKYLALYVFLTVYLLRPVFFENLNLTFILIHLPKKNFLVFASMIWSKHITTQVYYAL